MERGFVKAQSNNSFNPTALSLAFMMLARFNRVLLLASGGGLIRALGACS
jgi:hypothetical protein